MPCPNCKSNAFSCCARCDAYTCDECGLDFDSDEESDED